VQSWTWQKNQEPPVSGDGAGDANPGTGYIGEYAEKWNKRWDNKWRTNPKIKSPLANISGLCCVHCDHKDEYIIELQEENEKLKRLLKMAADEPEKSDAKSGG
jgi:hypothetical protein